MKRLLLGCLCAALLLSGCGTPTGGQEPSSSSQSGAASSQAQGSEYDRRDAIQRPEVGTEVVIDPPYDFDPEQMLPKDFGDHFLAEYPVETSTYLLAEGTDVENEVFVIKGQEEGPSLYIVAGVHGGEIAGWMTGNLLKKTSIKAGTLYILSPANRWGASAEPRSRYVTEQQDLNRSFPGDPQGNMAERVADSIYQDIQRVDPVFLFDLHEAQSNRENSDFLGSSLIYTSLDEMQELYMDLLLATESGEICSERFNFYAPGPVGSINNVVTNELGIPTITVETYRGYPLERRISDQLDIVEYVLTYYGLL